MYASSDFKNGYRLGVQKGRSIERKLALFLVLGFVFVFEIVHLFVFRFCRIA
jgi:hypothetical protein